MYVSENWTITTKDARRIIAAETKCIRITAGLIWTDYKTNTEIANYYNYLVGFTMFPHLPAPI